MGDPEGDGVVEGGAVGAGGWATMRRGLHPQAISNKGTIPVSAALLADPVTLWFVRITESIRHQSV